MQTRPTDWAITLVILAVAGLAVTLTANRPSPPDPTPSPYPTALDYSPTAEPTATATRWPTPTQITATQGPTPTDEPEVLIRCMASGNSRCNLRAWPDAEAPIVGQVWGGTLLELAPGWQPDDYWRAEGDGADIYCHKDYWDRVED